MFLNLLLLLIIIILVLLLLASRRQVTTGDEQPPLPTFPIPRPKSNFVDPPRREVRVFFNEQEGGVRPEPSTLILAPNQQAAWRSDAGKIEIRFNAADTPFGGTSFIAPPGGISLSGIPRPDARNEAPLNYLILFTTPAGAVFTQTAAVIVSKRGSTTD